MPAGMTELHVDVDPKNQVVVITSKAPLELHPSVVVIPFMAADAMYMQILQYRVQQQMQGGAIHPVSDEDVAALRKLNKVM